MIIYMDDEPKTAIPFLANDYSSSLLCSCLYEPLFISEGNKFTENLITDLSIGKNIKLLFKNFYWSDGTKVTPHDLKETLLYIIMNKIDKAWYLDFIEGVSDYLEGVSTDINNIKIFSDNDCLYIESLIADNQYKYIFSTIYFVPMRFINNKPSVECSYGAFKLEKFFEKLNVNKYYYNQLNENLTIVINDKAQENINHFLEGKCDLTSTTVFKQSDIHSLKVIGEEVRVKPSKLQLQLEVSNNYIHQKKYILKLIVDIIKNDKDLFYDILINDFSELEHFTNYNKLEKFSLLYSDYYPNNSIARKLLSKFDNEKVNVDYGDLNYFIDKYKHSNNYDTYLNVFSPVSHSTFDKYMTYLNFIIPEKKEEYINLLNIWIKGDIETNCIEEFISNYSRRVIIGYLIHYYLQSEKLNGLLIDENDNFLFKNVRRQK